MCRQIMSAHHDHWAWSGQRKPGRTIECGLWMMCLQTEEWHLWSVQCQRQSSSEGTCEWGIQTLRTWLCWVRSERQQIWFLLGQRFVYPESRANSPISFELTNIFPHLGRAPYLPGEGYNNTVMTLLGQGGGWGRLGIIHVLSFHPPCTTLLNKSVLICIVKWVVKDESWYK
jgi:hypothetical protein